MSEGIEQTDEVHYLDKNSILKRSGCYLIQREVDYVLKNSKYKIGRSQNIQSRMKSVDYRNARIISICYLHNEVECEKELIKTFSTKYRQITKSTNTDSGSYGKETLRT